MFEYHEELDNAEDATPEPPTSLMGFLALVAGAGSMFVGALFLAGVI